MNISIPHAGFPTTDWKEAHPHEVGMNEEPLLRMHASIQEQLPGLHALLIVRHGYLVFERYYQGFSRKSYHSVSSVTKSIISQLVGVALGSGLLKDLDQHVPDFFPEYASQVSDPRKQALTLRHLLSFKTGFSKQMPERIWLDPVQLALERPMEREPGQEFFYDNLSADVLSAVLTRVTGKSAAAFANETLFKQLGIWPEETARFTWRTDPQGAHTWHEYATFDEHEGYVWKVDPQGNSTGSFGAHLTAREMAKLGYLYLNGGLWDGTQVVPADYVAASTHEHSQGGPPVGAHYGYLWWIEQQEGYHAFFASGYGGKLIYVVPALDLIVVTAASTERAKKDPQQWKEIKALVPRFALPAIRENH